MVETIRYVCVLGIVVADVDRMYVRSTGHNIQPEVLIEYRKGREIWRVDGGLFRTSEEEGRCGLFCGGCCPITVQTKEAPTHRSLPEIAAIMAQPRGYHHCDIMARV